MKIKAENCTKLVNQLHKKFETAEPGDYLCFIPGMGPLMIKRSSRTSYNLNGKGIPKPKLHARMLDFAVENPGKVAINFILAADAEDYHGIYQNPAKIEQGDSNDEEEAPKDKKKDKSSKPKDEPKEDFGSGVGKKDLDKTYQEKAVKKMLKKAVADKKLVKKIMKKTTFEDGECSGFDILDGFDAATGKQATPGEADKIFS